MAFIKYISEYTDPETSELVPEVKVYPYNTRFDYPNTSFPPGTDYPGFDVYWVHSTTPNNPDPETLNVVEDTPVFNNELNRWEQTWSYVPKTAEEIRLGKYNPAQFLQQMFSDAAFESWISNFSTFKQLGFGDAATNAKVDNNWTVLQAIYDGFKSAIAPSETDIEAWQSIADDNGILFNF